MRRKKESSYDMDFHLDRSIVLDLPFSELNKRGRKAKRHKEKAFELRTKF